jgi:hypothetical protein
MNTISNKKALQEHHSFPLLIINVFLQTTVTVRVSQILQEKFHYHMQRP